MTYPIIAFVLCLGLVAQAVYFLRGLHAPRARRVLSPAALRVLALAGAAALLAYAAYDRDAVLFVGQAMVLPAFFSLRTQRTTDAQRDG